MNPLPLPDPALAITYKRVSSSEQIKGYGLGTQATAISGFVAREHLTVIGDYADPGVSGTVALEDRPGLSAALDAALRSGAGVLVVARHDRLARDTLVALLIEQAFSKAGVRIMYAEGHNGEDDSADFLRTIMHAAAEQDKKALVRRLRAARAKKASEHPTSRAQGGKVPHGYERTPTGLVIDPDAADEVRAVFALVRDGVVLRKVAERMTETTGRAWSSSTIEGIVKRDIYKRQTPGKIVDARIWNQAQDALAARRRSPGIQRPLT
jgi:DNA invertase Pin-like site-specific DNA recombinase